VLRWNTWNDTRISLKSILHVYHFWVVWVVIDVILLAVEESFDPEVKKSPRKSYLAPAPSTYHGKLGRSIRHLKPTEIQCAPTLYKQSKFCTDLFQSMPSFATASSFHTTWVPSMCHLWPGYMLNCLESWLILAHLFPTFLNHSESTRLVFLDDFCLTCNDLDVS
jgi:hypothetical protein